MTEHIKIENQFVSLALVPEGASSLLMPRTMGYQRAFATLVMGRKMSAEDAAKSAGSVTRSLSR